MTVLMRDQAAGSTTRSQQ
ncbi:Protein of unknown function [Propionibacterium freudenreichii subsp. freudenreichii]|uniref:Uncharacterized protein n=1 Tax=Propionibacterium freudenreichii subsp. freudenreichii TaxID=66712 RepID=A0A0B7NYJ6_PROFF|nr:Protein of unknown function [Propionibacterium freudenreichii]CEP26239.1 Protein of unknown function [Propionibacterium freudenreichii subsp. freudenreichii]CEG89762.1 Protein of unknown function [Propionibacterium freudenreichii]CEG92648.1 Protein of unknown function [Propionibacterium freudenreichii]CEH05221.1 Protein of unknown function [Propionibacterium freudenreichii]